MSMLRFFLKNKLFIHYLTIVVIVLGFVSLFLLQREARPNVNFNRVAISVFYPGASPSDVEELVIDPIEEKIAEVDGVEEYRSVSFVGAGSISVVVDDAYSNPQEIIDEIRRKVSEVKRLPIEVEDPVISEIKASNIPVINLALYGKLNSFDFKLETEKLKDFLQRQEGVQTVSYSGASDLQLKVLADKEKLDTFDITLNEVYDTLATWTKQKPGGLFENSEQVANLSIGKDVNEIEMMKKFVVRSNDSGQKITLDKIADIKYDLESKQTSSLYSDKEAVLFTVVKKPFSDSIKVVDAIKDSLDQYKKNLPDSLEVKVYKDQSIRIRDKLKIVISNAITGLLLVLFILLISLDWRSSLVTSIGIPLAILGGISLLYFFGHTMNSLVVVGMIIVLGMLVDDAIVVCENIYTHLEKGHSPMQSALKGTAEIALPVFASVLTTVFAFLPIIFMKEIIGQFLRVIPLTVVILLVVSLIEALVILPIHAEEIMKPKKKKSTSFFKKWEDRYSKYMLWSISKRWWIVLVIVVFTVVSLMQGKKIFEKFSLFPSEGLEGMSVRVELKKNTPLFKTEEIVQKLTQKLEAVSDNSFDNIYSNLGQVVTGGLSGSRQNGSHLAMIYVTFVSDPDFFKREKKVLGSIMEVVKKFREENNIKASVTIDRPGPPVGKPVQVQVTSRNVSQGEKIVEDIRAFLANIKGVHSIETDLDGDSVKYRFEIDRDYAVAEGISLAQVSRNLFASSTGVVSSEILKNNEKVEILLKLDSKNSLPIKELLSLKVRNRVRQAVPLSSFVKVIEEKGPSSIQRFNGLRTITLFAEVTDSEITGKEANALLKPKLEELRQEYPSAKIVVGGGEKDRMNALKDTMRLYILALLLIFMTISLTFQSLIYPFVVLTAIPMGISGVIWSLVLHGKSLTLMGVIGIVGLSGVVVNVSIILLKFVQDRLKEGMDLNSAIIDAGVHRLRPIIITTLTTLIGLLPTIYGVGGVDTFVQPIALVLGWGLFVATTLTLLCLPSLLSFFTVLVPKANTNNNPMKE